MGPKSGRELIEDYQKKYSSVPQVNDEGDLRAIFEHYDDEKKGFLNEQQAKSFLMDVLTVSNLADPPGELQSKINALFKKLGKGANVVYLPSFFKPHKVTVLSLLDSANTRNLEDICPPSFLCPITHELMSDPVLLLDSGQTYQRTAIEDWLRNHSTDPMASMTLKSKQLVPVLALKNSIQEWKKQQEDIQGSKKEISSLLKSEEEKEWLKIDSISDPLGGDAGRLLIDFPHLVVVRVFSLDGRCVMAEEEGICRLVSENDKNYQAKYAIWQIRRNIQNPKKVVLRNLGTNSSALFVPHRGKPRLAVWRPSPQFPEAEPTWESWYLKHIKDTQVIISRYDHRKSGYVSPELTRTNKDNAGYFVLVKT